jgi:putative membrane protein
MFAKRSGTRFPGPARFAGLSRWAGMAGWVFLMVGGLTAGRVQAQMQPGGGMQSPGEQPTAPQAGEATNPGVNPATNQRPGAESPQARMQQMEDVSFVKDVFKNDDAQVQLSQLAAQKSSSDDVKQFGEKMIQIHDQLNQQLQPLAKQFDVNQPKKPDKKTKKELAQLQALSGEGFDSAYLQEMAEEQQKGLQLFAKEAQSGAQTTAAAAAKQDEPILEQHFQVLQKIAAAHHVQVKSSDSK